MSYMASEGMGTLTEDIKLCSRECASVVVCEKPYLLQGLFDLLHILQSACI